MGKTIFALDVTLDFVVVTFTADNTKLNTDFQVKVEWKIDFHIAKLTAREYVLVWAILFDFLYALLMIFIIVV